LFFIQANILSAQVSFTFADKNVKSCDDFATKILNDPWDMSSSSDINNYFFGIDIQNFSNPQFLNGSFTGTTSSVASFFYLFSPAIAGAYSVGGRWGQNIGFDSTKYTRFSIKYSADKSDEVGLRMVWDRSKNYAVDRNVVLTGVNKFQTGNRTYSIDLPSLGDSTFQDDSTNRTLWNANPVTGLALIPVTKSGAEVNIDWIRLEDPTTCTGLGQSLSYNAAASGNDNLMNIYLVPSGVTNPMTSGYARKFTTATTPSNSSVNLSDTIGVPPGTYKTVALLDGDYATLERDNPWDFNDSSDVYPVGIGNNLTYSSGVASGTSDGTGANGILFLHVDSGINLSTYKVVTIKGTFTSAPSVIGPTGIYHTLVDSGGGYYAVDLSAQGTWTGTSGNFRIYIPSGPFTFDFVSARKSGNDVGFNRSASAVSAKMSTPSSANVIVNSPPSIDIKTPNEQGGEAIRPWNMNDGDLNIFANLLSGNDPTYPSEKAVSYLPDVRAVDGLRGDFFKGTSLNGSDDPINYSTFPFAGFNKFSFESSEYKNLCFRMLIDREFSLGTGSVGRVIYLADGTFHISEDLPLIYDGWSGSRWYNYCMDMTDLHTDGTTSSNWSGTIQALRIDPHEFNVQTPYYFDSIKLRKDYRAPGVFSVAYEASDADNDPIALTFYASTMKGSLGDPISGASFTVGSGSRVYNLDTTSLANGTYYINVQASDGVSNTVTRYGTGRVVVENGGSQGSAPFLSVEAPVQNETYCDSLQLKGYALQTDRFENVSTVEVIVDGNWLTNIYPDLFSLNAKTAYPSADSSNTGFNQLVDISALANGSHTASIIAHSTKGPSFTVTKNFTKAGTGCATPLTDPNPSGAPVVVNFDTTPTPRPTATPLPNPVTVSAATHSRSGTTTVVLKSIPSNFLKCKVNLFARETANSTPIRLMSTTIAAKEVSKKQMKLTAKKILVSSKGPRSLLLTNTVTCGSRTRQESRARTLRFSRSKSGSKTFAQITKALGKLKKA
jgi:hypothetical protein